jgi:XTP/dITP diphosphohydrolase|tara:strand:- start:1556 stop:2149 length:594 start_codon:yes stop_codon:yes gene_type:complete
LKNDSQILIASSNSGKIEEFKRLFKDHQIYSLSDFKISDAIEDGVSFIENALIKAKHGSFFSKKYTIADDSGLVVPDLGYEPGIFSARYARENATDEENRNFLINKIKKMKKRTLNAYYVCVMVGLKSHDDPRPIITQGEIHGKVSVDSKGKGGFGYDKIFYPSGYQCSMAEIDSEVKNKISHRAIATNKFLQLFNG